MKKYRIFKFWVFCVYLLQDKESWSLWQRVKWAQASKIWVLLISLFPGTAWCKSVQVMLPNLSNVKTSSLYGNDVMKVVSVCGETSKAALHTILTERLRLLKSRVIVSISSDIVKIHNLKYVGTGESWEDLSGFKILFSLRWSALMLKDFWEVLLLSQRLCKQFGTSWVHNNNGNATTGESGKVKNPVLLL